MFNKVCDALPDLVPFMQFKNPATLLKLRLLHWCFSRFLNCTNGTKSRNASHILSHSKPLLQSLNALNVYQINL